MTTAIPEAPQKRKPEIVVMNLECQLTDSQIKQCGKDLAEALRMRGETEARIATLKARAKADVEVIDDEISKMSVKIATEKERRDVDVKVFFDFPAGVKHFARTDTGEIVKNEPLTDEDRQEVLPV